MGTSTSVDKTSDLAGSDLKEPPTLVDFGLTSASRSVASTQDKDNDLNDAPLDTTETFQPADKGISISVITSTTTYERLQNDGGETSGSQTRPTNNIEVIDLDDIPDPPTPPPPHPDDVILITTPSRSERGESPEIVCSRPGLVDLTCDADVLNTSSLTDTSLNTSQSTVSSASSISSTSSDSDSDASLSRFSEMLKKRKKSREESRRKSREERRRKSLLCEPNSARSDGKRKKPKGKEEPEAQDGEEVEEPSTSRCLSCPICMDDFGVIVKDGRQLMSTSCGHVFCSVCIKAAIDSQKKCPTCRKNLTAKSLHPIFL